MTTAEVVTQPEFLRLYPQQQAWLREVCENGRDLMAATYKVYNCKTADSARTMTCRNMKNEIIRNLIDARFEKNSLPTREDLIKKLMHRGDKAKDDRVAVAAYNLAASLSGFQIKPSDPTPENRQESMLDAVRALENQ